MRLKAVFSLPFIWKYKTRRFSLCSHGSIIYGWTNYIQCSRETLTLTTLPQTLPAKLLLMDCHIVLIMSILLSHTVNHTMWCLALSQLSRQFLSAVTCESITKLKYCFTACIQDAEGPFGKIRIWKYMVSYIRKGTTGLCWKFFFSQIISFCRINTFSVKWASKLFWIRSRTRLKSVFPL